MFTDQIFIPDFSIMKKIIQRIEKYGIWILLFLWFLISCFRVWYFVYATVPLWYDPGMYKEIFTQYIQVLQHMNFDVLSGWVRHEPLLWIIAALLHNIGISFDWLITWGIGIMNLVPGLLLFWFLKSRKQTRVGLLAALLYRTSIVQYEVFWWGYFKQTIGVSLMILILLFREQKKLFLQSILFFLLILLHRHTAVFTWILLGILVLHAWFQHKRFPWKKIMYLSIAGICALLLYIPLRSRVMPEAIKAVATTFWWDSNWGDFMNILIYLKLQWPILLLSLFGAWTKIKEKKIDGWLLWYIVAEIRILCSLVNFNRTIVFLDIFVIVFAARALIEIIRMSKKMWLLYVWMLFACIFCIWNSIHYLWYVADRNIPLISEEEFTSIKSLNSILEKDAIVMNTHRNYSPWIMWRSQRAYINPGMSDMDMWTHANWNQRRANDGRIKCTMLKQTYAPLQRPLYIWMWEQQFTENILWWDCFSLVSDGTTWKLYRIF